MDRLRELYDKNEVSFALFWIAFYVFGTILAQGISQQMGTQGLVEAIFHIFCSIFVLSWIQKNHLCRKYGLIKPQYPWQKAWYFLPLLFIACFNLFFGWKLQYSPFVSVLLIISMLCVGYLEEIIFRGFLFLAMAKENLFQAVLVSSLTFGLGHIVNLVSGAPFLPTLMQILFATAVGFTLALLFYKGKSLLPCIFFHSLNNALSVLGKTNAEVAAIFSMPETLFELLMVLFFVLILGVYSMFSLRKLEEVTPHA